MSVYLPQVKKHFRSHRLENKSVLNSKGERQAWIANLAECLRYASIQGNEFAAELATGVHRTWLEKVLDGRHDGALRAHLVEHSAVAMAALVRYWLKRAEEERGEKYDRLVRNFWQNIESTLLTQISASSTDRGEIALLAEAHVSLVTTLQTGRAGAARGPRGVAFDGDAPRRPEGPASPAGDAAAQLLRHNLDGLAARLAAAWLERAGAAALPPLVPLLREFAGRGLFAAVAERLRARTPLGLYERVLRAWLADDAARCGAVFDVVFLLVDHLGEAEQDAVFRSFEQVGLSVPPVFISGRELGESTFRRPSTSFSAGRRSRGRDSPGCLRRHRRADVNRSKFCFY